MSIIHQKQEPVYTIFGDINRPSEKVVFLILHLQTQLNNDCLLNRIDKEILRMQNCLALGGNMEIEKLCMMFNLTRKRMERKLLNIEKKLMIEYLRERL